MRTDGWKCDGERWCCVVLCCCIGEGERSVGAVALGCMCGSPDVCKTD